MDETRESFFQNGTHVTGVTAVMRSAADLYAAWRDLEQLPRFIPGLDSVETLSGGRSRWTARGPAGMRVSWEADLLRDEPGSMLVWKTVDGSEVSSAGTVRFRDLPFGRGAEVRVIMEYVAPAGALGRAVASLSGDNPKRIVKQALHSFRQVMETGEVTVSKGQPAGANAFRSDRPGESDTRKTDPDVRDIAGAKGVA